MAPYHLDLDDAIRQVKAKGARRVLIQAPDGLKQYVKELTIRLGGAGILAITSADPCFGGCDLAYQEAEMTGADLILHIGHRKFRDEDEKVPTIYLPADHKTSIKKLAALTADLLRGKGVRIVGLVTTVQHQGYLGQFRRLLAQSGLEVIIDRKSGGLILGCQLEGAKRLERNVDAFVFLGGGDFHGLGVALAVEKEVYIADPYRGEVREVEALKKKILAKRWWAIMEATKARSIGIIMVTRSGQYSEEATFQLKRRLEEAGREVFLIAMGEVTWDRMAPFSFVEAFVVTGCPRISLDNQESFPVPVLNQEDALELLKRV